jgi:hypothetical protein
MERAGCEGPPPALLRAGALGRRQVVRQRILIPPYGGSNPPAPAIHSHFSETLPEAAERPTFRGLLRGRKSQTRGRAFLQPLLRPRSPMQIFQFPERPIRGRSRPVRSHPRRVRKGALTGSSFTRRNESGASRGPGSTVVSILSGDTTPASVRSDAPVRSSRAADCVRAR